MKFIQSLLVGKTFFDNSTNFSLLFFFVNLVSIIAAELSQAVEMNHGNKPMLQQAQIKAFRGGHGHRRGGGGGGHHHHSDSDSDHHHHSHDHSHWHSHSDSDCEDDDDDDGGDDDGGDDDGGDDEPVCLDADQKASLMVALTGIGQQL